MKILVGFEFSGIVSQAFRAKGHEVYSCDLVPRSGDPFHFQEDFFITVLRMQWDMILTFPPCTYLAKCQIFRLQDKERYSKMLDAVDVVKRIWNLNCPLICIENPSGILTKMFQPCTQIIQPYFFGNPHRKETQLWLKGLPPLMFTCENPVRKSMQNHCNSRMSQERKSMIKSTFFPQVADAMANQWNNL
jgi:hypothetical protein